ncbi:MAG: hypothetical protein ACKVZH_08550, partial [Blastocatellia bacterium]
MNSVHKRTRVILFLAVCALAGALLGSTSIFRSNSQAAAVQSGSKNDVGTNPAPRPFVTPNGNVPTCTVNGTTGQGSPDKPGVSGAQSGRIFRD